MERTSLLGKKAKYEEEPLRLIPELRRALTEFFGSFIQCLVSAMPPIIEELTGDKSATALSHLGEGIVVVALIYGCGQISGAHFNPLVSLAFFLRRVFDIRRLAYYVVAQFLGAISAGALLYSLFGKAGEVGSTYPQHITEGQAVGLELIFTMGLVFVALCVATRAQLIGVNAGIPIGAIVAAFTILGDDLTGASMDPARSLGTALFAGGYTLKVMWVYIVGPLAGTLIAVGLIYILSDSWNEKEEETATGLGTAIEEGE